jgi:hypothetical protein
VNINYISNNEVGDAHITATNEAVKQSSEQLTSVKVVAQIDTQLQNENEPMAIKRPLSEIPVMVEESDTGDSQSDKNISAGEESGEPQGSSSATPLKEIEPSSESKSPNGISEETGDFDADIRRENEDVPEMKERSELRTPSPVVAAEVDATDPMKQFPGVLRLVGLINEKCGNEKCDQETETLLGLAKIKQMEGQFREKYDAEVGFDEIKYSILKIWPKNIVWYHIESYKTFSAFISPINNALNRIEEESQQIKTFDQLHDFCKVFEGACLDARLEKLLALGESDEIKYAVKYQSKDSLMNCIYSELITLADKRKAEGLNAFATMAEARDFIVGRSIIGSEVTAEDGSKVTVTDEMLTEALKIANSYRLFAESYDEETAEKQSENS